MLKSEAITLHVQEVKKPGNERRFPVFVWAEGEQLVSEVDGLIFRAGNVFGLDSLLSDAGMPAPRNLYFVDEPDYEDNDAREYERNTLCPQADEPRGGQ